MATDTTPWLRALLEPSERRFMQMLVSTSRKSPGLAPLFGWTSWHDRATNAPRACPTCKAELNLPRNDPGWPDLFLLREQPDGSVDLLVVELKVGRNNVTDDQERFLSLFRRVTRIRAATWHPKDWPLIERILR